jgi:hypothetical protein
VKWRRSSASASLHRHGYCECHVLAGCSESHRSLAEWTEPQPSLISVFISGAHTERLSCCTCEAMVWYRESNWYAKADPTFYWSASRNGLCPQLRLNLPVLVSMPRPNDAAAIGLLPQLASYSKVVTGTALYLVEHIALGSASVFPICWLNFMSCVNLTVVGRLAASRAPDPSSSSFTFLSPPALSLQI